jgi:MoaA/NifB/PqqE/SkfB family radical SAM enzyme
MEKLIDPGNKILRFPQYLLDIKEGRRVYPLHVEVDLSNNCPLSCYWCLYQDMHDTTQMDYQLGIKILDQLEAVGVQAITFSGGGEPTTNLYFSSFVVHAKHSCGFDVGVYTHGISRERLFFVLDSITWLFVSLDAYDRENYKKIKGMDRFDTVLRNVREIVQSDKARNTTIGLGFVLREDNWMKAPEMFDIGQDLGVDYVQFRPTLGLEEYHWVNTALPILEALEHKGNVLFPRQRYIDLMHQQHGMFDKGYTICRGSELVNCIGADGSVWVCTNLRGIRKLGDLKTESFVDIWARRETQYVDADCQPSCRDHELNKTLEYMCSDNKHKGFV